MRFELKTNGTVIVDVKETEILEFIDVLISRMIPSKSPTLSFDLENLRLTYPRAKWIENRIPYELVADMNALARVGWLDLVWDPKPFSLPFELQGHRDHMIDVFRGMGRLRRTVAGILDDQACPRLLRNDAAEHRLLMQQARYSQQIATNLSLDYPLEEPLRSKFGITIRQLDMTHALVDGHLSEKPVGEGELRAFEESILANTLGVCCLILFEDGKTLWRMKSDKNAIYQNQAHVPVSFAQEIQTIATEFPRTLEGLISQDLPTEFHQETGLELGTYITYVRPVALCRDIFRAGKPQLFLFLEARCDSPAFITALKGAPSADEYKKKKSFAIGAADDVRNMSTELAASLYFLQQSQRQAVRL